MAQAGSTATAVTATADAAASVRPAAEPAGRPAVAATSRRALIVSATGAGLVERLGALIADLVGRRHRVLCLAPHLTAADAAKLAALGAETRPWPAKSSFLRVLADRSEASALRGLVADWQPHVALIAADEATLPVLTAARHAQVPRVLALIDGLPQFEADARPNTRRWRRGLEQANGAVFYNADDARTLTAAGVLAPAATPVTVAGGGVDLSRNGEQRLPGLADGLVFAMIATLDRRHGLDAYLEAAEAVASQARNARFLLAGPLPAGDGGAASQAITAQAITGKAGIVEYLGALDDPRPVLARAHVFVYPARGEGLPRPVMEALAAGRPVITTDTPGCRDTVDERVNGCLVPPGDAAALAEAMASFLRRPDLIPSMARAARLKAERRFDEQAATARLAELMGLR